MRYIVEWSSDWNGWVVRDREIGENVYAAPIRDGDGLADTEAARKEAAQYAAERERQHDACDQP